ncbi:MAG TPA: three-Cys-motif partner protein TcmP [Woeseiaceae bacterium]|nr:three-Cys-motif partner protein TcmP [Woeseiaceae bacterium]
MDGAGCSIQSWRLDSCVMPRVGRGHFAEYTPQNRVKHEILTKYFAAYLTALRKTADAFHYIDGFAGPGMYAEGEPGSPLHAIELLASQPNPASASFVEHDPALHDSLKHAIANARGITTLFDSPLIERGEFAEFISAILARPIYKRFRKVATFAFVDPCGVDGLRMADLTKILATQFGECLVFWNYAGLSRWIGGVAAGKHSRSKLNAFFGSAETASDAIEFAQSRVAGAGKERYLRDSYLHAVSQHAGARYLLPFRFRASDAERTSHYLMHLCCHSLGFVIMKEVMKKAASSAGDFGTFQFVPKDELGEQTDMFHPSADRARREVITRLEQGAESVRLFTREWTKRPGDFLVADQYKDILLDLESSGALEVLDGRTRRPKPVDKRLRKGQVTLGDQCIVRLI